MSDERITEAKMAEVEAVLRANPLCSGALGSAILALIAEVRRLRGLIVDGAGYEDGPGAKALWAEQVEIEKELEK